MPSTQEILDAAEKLGEMVAGHEAAQKLESAVKALEKDTAAQQMIRQFNEHLQALSQKEATGRPIEVADKRKLESLQQAVVMNVMLRNFQQAQMDYVDLLRKVDQKITGSVDADGANLFGDPSEAADPGHAMPPGGGLIY